MVRERESIDAKGLCRYRDGVTEDSPHIALFWDVLQVREREGGGGIMESRACTRAIICKDRFL